MYVLIAMIVLALFSNEIIDWIKRNFTINK